jgi:erythromycin esterase-like protein
MKAFVVAVSSASLLGQSATSHPIDATTAIVEAFRTHSIVALGEGPHGNEPGHRFRLALIRDPKFAQTVNDIVLEAGNARFQDLADRYVNGEPIPLTALQIVWQESTQVQLTLDQPHFDELFETVRNVNAKAAPARRLRVLLGDPPIDWSDIHSAADHRKWIEMRDIFGADVIQRETIEKGRRGLLVTGDGHVQRKNVSANYESAGLAQTVVSRLEDHYHAKVFSILTGTVPDLSRWDPSITSWKLPAILNLRGTRLGAVEFADITNMRTPRFRMKDGQPDFPAGPIPQAEWRTLKTEDQYDALLYLGPLSSPALARSRPTLCDDRPYIEKRLARLALVGAPPIVVDQLKNQCGLQ